MTQNKKLKSQETDFIQINKFISGAWKKLRSAEQNLKIDEQVSYQLAYEAMIRASLGFMLSFSVRPRSLLGHHMTIIDFVEKKLGKDYKRLIGLFDNMRKKRNRFIYEAGVFITEHEAEEALKTAEKFIGIIEKEIQTKNPQEKLV